MRKLTHSKRSLGVLPLCLRGTANEIPAHLLVIRLRSWERMPLRTPLAYLASNLISLIGVVVVTTSGILWLLALPAFWRGEASTPYIGILLFLVLPGLFFLGLILIPVGIVLQTRKRHQAGDRGPFIPRGGELRKLGIFVAVTTVANLVMGSQFTYRAVTYMDTDTFCGKSCHTVMQPEYTAYVHSPHARVACTDCHIGPGASFFVKSKLSGAGQVLAVLFNSYPRADPVAGGKPSPRARDLRAVPLAAALRRPEIFHPHRVRSRPAKHSFHHGGADEDRRAQLLGNGGDSRRARRRQSQHAVRRHRPAPPGDPASHLHGSRTGK